MEKITMDNIKNTSENRDATAFDKHFKIDDIDFHELEASILDLFRPFFDKIDHSLSTVERLRKLGSGVRRYGFIDKTSDVAEENMQFAPRMYDNEELKDLVRQIEDLRNLLLLLEQCSRVVSDQLLVTGDDAFRMALLYYNSVRELSRRQVPGAEQVFRMLNSFFRRTRRTAEEPTEHEIERDLHALMHGKKDGKIVIEHEAPHVSGGIHTVVDETHKPAGHWKEKAEGEIEE
jgi:hypothetical protein